MKVFQLRADAPRNRVWRPKGMLPDSKDSPSGLLEAAVRFSIPTDVPADLALPVCAVVLRHSQMPTAAMPEAAIHEDCEAFVAEDEIGLARE